MSLTTTTEIPAAVRTIFDKVLLKVGREKLLHDMFGQQRNFDKNSGDTIVMRRIGDLSAATTPISEGVTPSGSQLSKTDLTARVSQYGDYVHLTDVVDMTVENTSEGSAMATAFERLARQMNLTRDTLIREILSACASSTNASGGSNGGTPTEITKTDIDGVVDSLIGANAEMLMPQITATNRVGTIPVREAYWAIIHTDIRRDLEACDDYLHKSRYSNDSGAVYGELGSVNDVRFAMTTNGKKTTDTPAQYYIPIIGAEAYGLTTINGTSQEGIIKPMGSAGSADPLNQRATCGWKMWFVARILNDDFMHILKVTRKLGA